MISNGGLILFRYCFKIVFLYISLILIFNKCSIGYKIPNINQIFQKTNLYSHRNGQLYSYSTDSVAVEQHCDHDQLDVINRPTKLPYNKYPKFCLGKYRFFDFNLSDGFGCKGDISKIDPKLREIDFFKKSIPYLNLLTKCVFNIQPYGNYTISLDEEYEDFKQRGTSYEDESVHIKSLRVGFSDKTLSMLKRMFDQKNEEEDKEFMEQLKQQPFGKYEVKDLISDVQVSDTTREDLLKFLESNIMIEEPQELLNKIENIGWEYIPSTKSVDITMYFKDVDMFFNLSFKLYPGQKSLIIDKSTAKIKLQGNQDSSSRPKPMKKFNLNIGNIKVKYIDETVLKKMVKNEPSNTKIKFINVQGNKRQRFNEMFNLINMISNNLPMKEPIKEVDIPPEITVSKEEEAVDFKMLNVFVNSQFKFMIPLITYLDFTDGKSYLCNNTFRIEEKPERVMPLSSGSYSDYNMRFVPECYRNSGFFSNLHMKFSQDQILNILSSYLEFKKLIYDNNVSEQTKPFAELSSNDLTFEKLESQSPAKSDEENTNTNNEPEEFAMYRVNGKNKMIYKSSKGAMLINLLL